MNKTSCLFIFLLMLSSANAQTLLSAEKAVAEALEKNFGILLAKNNQEIAAINNTLGNAGFLPQINASLSEVMSNNNIDQRFANGLEVQRDNVAADNFSAGLNLNWTLFDGFRMFAMRNRLKETYELSRTELYIEVQQTVFDVLSQYYRLAMLMQQLKVTDDVISLGLERKKIAEQRFLIGDAAKTDLLQARIDLNNLYSSKIAIRQMIAEEKQNLLFLLGRSVDADFNVSDSIPLPTAYDLQSIEQAINVGNPEYKAARSRLKISEFAFKEAKAMHYPQIQFLSSYNFSRVSSEAGFALFNRNVGFNYGIGAQIPLYAGGLVNREKKLAKANIIAASIVMEQTMALLKTETRSAYSNLMFSIEKLAYEKENKQWAEEQIFIALEQFKKGAINSLQLKDAQLTYEQSSLQYTKALYEAQLADLRLQRVSGRLIR